MTDNVDISHISSLILVAGLSGAGKSSAQNALEDSGYFVVDNLPVALFSQLIEHTRQSPQKYRYTALLMLVDSMEKQEAFLLSLKKLDEWKQKTEVVFLDCTTDVIIKRYSETRRPHPSFDTTKDEHLMDTIERERARLAPIKELANVVIDTTELTGHDLRRKIRDFTETLPRGKKTALRVNFNSFGFKYGLPTDCDLVVDVRFLKNPYFNEKLRHQTGRDKPVQDYVLEQSAAKEFITRYEELLLFLLPKYQHEGKAYLNVGIGCTGGKHRSVTVAETLLKNMKSDGCSFSVSHRDIGK